MVTPPNPAKLMYDWMYATIRHWSPEYLRRPEGLHDPDWTNEGSYWSPRYARNAYMTADHLPISVAWKEPWQRGKPVILIGHHMMWVWPDGSFRCLMGTRAERHWKPELNLYAKHTFLQWGYTVKNEKALFVAEKEPLHGYHPTEWVDVKDLERRRPYLTLFFAEDVFHKHVRYRLVWNGTDWIIKPVAVVASAEVDHPQSALKIAQQRLDGRYAFGERRYRRHERAAEIAAQRNNDEPGKPRSTRAFDAAAAIETFSDNLTVYEPKFPPGMRRVEPNLFSQEAPVG